ncbi:MAG: hypothetical protein DWQ37_04560 [Planctomycetota bacterium]|nr:MAG: hypothetical protein DWQ37_04560 [Planctomycetota bacterium]
MGLNGRCRRSPERGFAANIVFILSRLAVQVRYNGVDDAPRTKEMPMDLPRLEIHDEFIEIPRLFRTFEGQPFEQCLICEKKLGGEGLLDAGEQYVIERSFVGEEPIYEFAICLTCIGGMQCELSAESRMRMEAHFEERVDLVERRRSLLDQSREAFDPWIDTCLLTGKKRQEARAYTVYAHCWGRRLLFSYLPYMITDAGIEGLERLLSKQTRETLDDFVGQNLGMPPEFQDLPRSPALFF